MPKRLALVLLVGLLLLVTACKSATPEATPTATTAPQAPTQASSPTSSSSFELGEPVSIPGCTVVSLMPTAGPTEESLFPSHKDTDWALGPEDAAVKLIVYSDFQ